MKAVILAVALVTSLVSAGECPECPAPKKLSCDQLLAKAVQRCSPGKIDSWCQCDEPICPEATICPPPPPAEVKTVKVIEFVDSPMPRPKDTFTVGVGPLYMHAAGAVAMGAYTHHSGFGIQAQALYIPQHDVDPYAASVTYRCNDIPFTVPGVDERHPFGGAVLATYQFPIGGHK